MPINVFGNSSHDSKNRNDISIFVQKPCLRTSYLVEDID